MVMGRVVLPLTILIGGAIDDFGSVRLEIGGGNMV